MYTLLIAKIKKMDSKIYENRCYNKICMVVKSLDVLAKVIAAAAAATKTVTVWMGFKQTEPVIKIIVCN